MKIKLLIAAAATVVASSAMAQSAFEGAYGQLGVGYENNSISSRTFTFTSFTTPSDNGSASASTSSGGGLSSNVGLGYNMSVAPQWLVGIGADYSFTNVTTSTVGLYNGASAGVNVNYKVANRYNIFLTPGYEIDKDKLVYVKGGFSSQSLTWQGQNTIASLGNKSTNVNGYVAGLGYKQLLDKNLYVFGEGNYYSYSSTTLSGNTEDGTLSQKQTPSAYQFLVGLGYKF
ncbi:outer membrane beta-barrel protein [Polynucleobacter paneuropaeus]|nr:outer membrane beta-barrel protein [Polynucleobacter paneuropaeus]MBT8554875.1 outer membrane beta-barrel protein [Polynucleobacter paneuropaeus]MBT8560151.1 outer membrane beta-barrel protein [Polynucleobacter paneuropaeus]